MQHIIYFKLMRIFNIFYFRLSCISKKSFRMNEQQQQQNELAGDNHGARDHRRSPTRSSNHRHHRSNSRSPPRHRRLSSEYIRMPRIERHTRTDDRFNHYHRGYAKDPYYRPTNQVYQRDNRNRCDQRVTVISKMRFSSWEQRCINALCAGITIDLNYPRQLVRRVLRRFEHHYDGRGLVLDFIELLEMLPPLSRSKMIHDNNTDAVIYSCYDLSKNYKSYYDNYKLCMMIPLEYLDDTEKQALITPIDDYVSINEQYKNEEDTLHV